MKRFTLPSLVLPLLLAFIAAGCGDSKPPPVTQAGARVPIGQDKSKAVIDEVRDPNYKGP